MKRLIWLMLGVVIVIMLAIAGCSARSNGTTSHEVVTLKTSIAASGGGGPVYSTTVYRPVTTTTAAMTKTAMPMPAPSPTAMYQGGNNSGVTYGADQNTPSSSDRMVVRNGNIQMVVNQIASSLENINQIASRYGGYLVNSQQWKEGDRNIGSISIRVLADKYDQAMADIRAMAKSVTTESTSSQDVTEEYTDLNAQIKNLQASEAQLQKIMEGATKTEDILSIQQQLTNVRGQIEQIKGRMNYLERTSSTSLINIRMEEAVLALKFNAARVSAGTNEEVAFTCDVIGGFAPYNYYWDFGDGNTSVERAPSHNYKSAGSYTVMLRVTDDKGYTNTLAREAYINIVGSWKPYNVAHNAWSGLGIFARGLVNFLIWIGIFSFVWVPIGAAVWFFVFYKRRKNHIR
jgi:PKD repeat protein